MFAVLITPESPRFVFGVKLSCSGGTEEQPSGPSEESPHALLPPQNPTGGPRGGGPKPTFDCLGFLRRVPTMQVEGRLFYQCAGCHRHYPGLVALLLHSVRCATASSARGAFHRGGRGRGGGGGALKVGMQKGAGGHPRSRPLRGASTQ
ncbi:hypothetical protein AAFF_G00228810 [Aldrovandia affinis]|uniref:Uncharacterized protein n=1 Tax=Aldrovandia affinis TaxID=143900 RepID=A0AAD7SVK4_9TELE|nr:hypothetical protein AAFF_G00228810 [Aldrovandia affinis]